MAKSLMLAVEECRYVQARLLLDQGVHIDSRDHKGHNALITAFKISNPRKRHRMFKWLLQQGADSLYIDKPTGRDLLTWASVYNRTPEIDYLLDVDEGLIDLRWQDKQGRTALHYSTFHNNEHAVYLITSQMRKYGLSVDIPDVSGVTPFIVASVLGFRHCEDILRTLGEASPNQADIPVFDMGALWQTLRDLERITIVMANGITPKILNSISPANRKAVVVRCKRPVNNPKVQNGSVKSGSENNLSLASSSVGSSPRLPVLHSTKNLVQAHDLEESTDTKYRPPSTAPAHIAFPPLYKDVFSSMPLVYIPTKECSTVPNLLDILSQQNTYTYRPAAKPPVRPKSIEPKKPSLSFRTAVKISAFAAYVKKKRANKGVKS